MHASMYVARLYIASNIIIAITYILVYTGV